MTTNTDKLAAQICRDVAELPDRNSPEDWPEAMLVTHDELQAIVTEALSAAGRVQQAEPVAWMDEWGNTFPLAAKQYSTVSKNWRALYLAPTAQEASKPVQAEAPKCSYPQCTGDQPEDGACCKVPFTSAMADAAERYWRTVGPHAHPLPAQFRWADCFRATEAAATKQAEAWREVISNVANNLGEFAGGIPITQADMDTLTGYIDELFGLLATQPPAIPAAPTVQASGEREAFEAAMRKRYGVTNFARSPDGYVACARHEVLGLSYASVQMLWEAWQDRAARSTGEKK